MTVVIETNSLTKVFGKTVALEDLSITVNKGEIFGFLGPNGAGKTTAIGMLLGLIKPTSGDARILGKNLGDVASFSRIGFLPEHFRFHAFLTGTEFLRIHGQLFSLDKKLLEERIKQLLNQVDLWDARERKLNQYSKGMLQRIGLAQALINEPELVFLDEPTSGLDPSGRVLVRNILNELRGKGTTVFLNSHYLSEVEIVCDRVAIINKGHVAAVGRLNELIKTNISVRIELRTIHHPIIDYLNRAEYDYEIDGNKISISNVARNQIPEINKEFVSRGGEIYTISTEEPSLEEVFIQVINSYGESG